MARFRLSNVNNADNSLNVGSTYSSVDTRVAIICSKRHEFDEFCKLMTEGLGSYSIVPSLCEHEDYAYKMWQCGTLVFMAFTFGDVRGSIQTAIRTAEVILEHRPTHVGMVGVCAGRKLGDVIVAKSASAPESGRIQKRGDEYVLINKEGDDYVDRGGIPMWIEEKVSGFVKMLEGRTSKSTGRYFGTARSFQVHLGTMHSYPQVREDCEEKLPRGLQIGLDMETSTFFRTVDIFAKTYSVNALPVVKGISNVGEENMRACSEFYEHNTREPVTNTGLVKADNATVRRAYRAFAAKNAAEIAVQLIRTMFCEMTL